MKESEEQVEIKEVEEKFVTQRRRLREREVSSRVEVTTIGNGRYEY